MTGKKRGGPPPTGMENRKHSGTVCTATRRDGSQCTNFAINGATVCRMHGGSAPQVRRAAQVRLLMQADNLMAALLKIALNERLPVQHRLVAIRDGLDRANLAGVQNVEVTVEKGKTFEDWVGEAIVDVEEDDDPNVYDAEVVEDEFSTPLVPRDDQDEPPMNRHDRAMLAEVERSRSRRARPGGMTDQQRARAEADLMAEQRHAEHLEQQAEIDRDREAMLLAKANGTWNPSSRGEALREAAQRPGRKRRTRVRDGGFGDS